MSMTLSRLFLGLKKFPFAVEDGQAYRNIYIMAGLPLDCALFQC